jgi:hypothetical protein
MNSNVLSSKRVLLIATTMLSAMMLAASPMASLVPTTAFAQEISEGGVEVDPILQTDVQADVNANVDAAVVTDEEDCDEASDDVTQEILQPSDQQASRDVEAGEGSLYISPIIQIGEQLGYNLNADLDVILVDGCQPADELTQTTSQSSDQFYNRDIEAGEGSNLILPTTQTAGQIAGHTDINEDILAPLPQ